MDSFWQTKHRRSFTIRSNRACNAGSSSWPLASNGPLTSNARAKAPPSTPSTAAMSNAAINRPAYRGRPARGGDARQELALPDLRGHRRNEFVDYPAPAIDQERFRRPVDTPVDG